MLEFCIPINPMPMQTAGKRLIVSGGKPRFFLDSKAQKYLNSIIAISAQYRPKSPFPGPIIVELTFILPRPKYMATSKQPEGLIPHTKTPDLDNLLKGVLDGLTKAGFWTNDAVIHKIVAMKFVAEKDKDARILVSIKQLDAS